MVQRGEMIHKTFKIPKFSKEMVQVLIDKYWDDKKLEGLVIF
jgi:hypothetical protein